jgi:hypothetical protein
MTKEQQIHFLMNQLSGIADMAWKGLQQTNQEPWEDYQIYNEIKNEAQRTQQRIRTVQSENNRIS